jgi:hypothetical protein
VSRTLILLATVTSVNCGGLLRGSIVTLIPTAAARACSSSKSSTSLFRANWSVAVLAFAVVGGCAAQQRAQVAHEAQDKLIGLRKEQVLACMGVPANKAAEGSTEVWSYNSGNGQVVASAFGNSTTNASGIIGVSSRRFCTVDVVMTDGVVSKVNYNGPTGGLLTAGEQCAFAVENCVR